MTMDRVLHEKFGTSRPVYSRRMLEATQEQWPRMHEKTATKLHGLETRLGSFYAGDGRDYLGQVLPEAPVVMFPPFYSGDYTSQFAPLDAAFNGPEPTFGELDEAGEERFIEQVQDWPDWVLGLRIERTELRSRLAGVVQTEHLRLPTYVYAVASVSPSRSSCRARSSFGRDAFALLARST
ncbi:hypothetical protein ACIOEZ_07030 [Streptomyces sp. NPDC087866]|uniref:putative antirestriction adenine methyltransferase n=1 Tax=unclassified Streptomyces TaxID=2593676 RepID=UPI0034520507